MIYDISSKTLIDAKPLPVRINRIDRFTRVYDGTRYLVLFGVQKYDFIYHRIWYLIGLKKGIKYVISHNCAKNQNWFIWFFALRKNIYFV